MGSKSNVLPKADAGGTIGNDIEQAASRGHRSLAKVGRITTLARKAVVRSKTFQEGDMGRDHEQKPR